MKCLACDVELEEDKYNRYVCPECFRQKKDMQIRYIIDTLGYPIDLFRLNKKEVDILYRYVRSKRMYDGDFTKVVKEEFEELGKSNDPIMAYEETIDVINVSLMLAEKINQDCKNLKKE